MGSLKESAFKTNMKFVLLVFAFMAIIEANKFLTKEEANSKLILPSGRTRRAAIGFFGGKKSVADIKKEWNSYCDFYSVEQWIEFKDDVEEIDLPEGEVESLEKCTYWCARNDEALDFNGNAYEEKREDRKENGSPFKPACPQCFKDVPKSGSFKFPKVKNGKLCKNSESGGIFG